MRLSMGTGVLVTVTTACILGCLGLRRAAGEPGEFVQWARSDFYDLPGIVDDHPNAESFRITRDHFTPLVPETVVPGTKGELSFRILPRSEEWFGIMVVDRDGRPRELRKGRERETIVLVDPVTRESESSVAGMWGGKRGKGVWRQIDSRFLYTDAVRVYLPKTTIRVTKGKGEVVDEATVDFSRWKFTESQIRMADLLDGPTEKRGFVTAKDGQFLRDGRPIYFWGGHENHVPAKDQTDWYCEVFSEAGLNLMRHLGIEERILKDPVTGEMDEEQMDNYHYLVAKLGERGIYLFISHFFGYLNNNPKAGVYGYAKEEVPYLRKGRGTLDGVNIWVDPKIREGWKKFLRNFFTAVNPYNGKAIKDDPTVVGFELSNETGLNHRRFDFNMVTMPKSTMIWRRAFNEFLLTKYGNRKALARAWQTEPLRAWEDPSKDTILVPSNYRGSRHPYGGTGQHDQFVIGKYYRNGLPAFANPRIVDAIEFRKKCGPEEPGPDFDYNNPTTPEETARWRTKWNQFLLDKYGDRGKLADAWKEEPLFRWEDPARNTILIPTNYGCETGYKADLTSRVASPRISDAREFTYQVQKDWATDMADFLKNEVGLKCGIGWNGDSFQAYQTPCHKANMDALLDIAIHAVYRDWDQGDQDTSRLKNLKRINTYGRIYGRPSHSYEWSAWYRQTPYPCDYVLLVALLGRVYGFDGFSHHKMGCFKYPVRDPVASLINYINPLLDKRRGAFQVAAWILKRSRIPESSSKVIVGYPHDSAFVGGPVRRMSNPAFENWLQYQFGCEDYSFKNVYDGPTDRVVIHSGHGPYGDYRKARHAILWCHSNTDREGKDPEAKKKWFALHGIKFERGQKYYLDDHYFATTEDMTDYNVVHQKAEQNRWAQLQENARKFMAAVKERKVSIGRGAPQRVDDDYWAPEKGQKLTELDRQLYQALKRWGHPLPFGEEEIDRVWRGAGQTMEMDTTKLYFRADRDDMQVWFGRLAKNDGRIRMSRLEVDSAEPQYCCALLPWDTADFRTSKVLAFWTFWNSEATIKLDFPKPPAIYAVNWLGKRLFQVKPINASDLSVTFMTARSDDIFCYEIVR